MQPRALPAVLIITLIAAQLRRLGRMRLVLQTRRPHGHARWPTRRPRQAFDAGPHVRAIVYDTALMAAIKHQEAGPALWRTWFSLGHSTIGVHHEYRRSPPRPRGCSKNFGSFGVGGYRDECKSRRL